MPITIKPYLDIQFDQPKVYLVTILSSDYVSWEFCMKILIYTFHMTPERAKTLTNEILTNGEALCGVYILEIAETKAVTVEEQAKKEGFTLCCLVEEV
ncbi:MAG: ATP-dependent Clp protease adaptor protein ClpS [Sulfurimonas sp.]|jgi:ATP-dependent Clp protease adaptor protein ClpS|uniref:ATP-dependent Clp protease adaptor ClpS n=1 Tax=Sulfurimonas sp. TaxID=2022749 RepID=UPI0039E6712D